MAGGIALTGVLALSAAGGVGWLAASAAPLSLSVEVNAADEESQSALRPVASHTPAALRLPTCSLDAFARDPALASFSGTVYDPLGGTILFDRSRDVAVAPASVMKIITAAAALTVLGPEATLQTLVRATDNPNTVALVAGGDPTLRAVEGSNTVYVGAPSMSELARQTIGALSENLAEGEKLEITALVVDQSLWDAKDSWDPSWAERARSQGFVSRVVPLQVDGDRRNPATAESPRGNDPARTAADAFVRALREAGNTSGGVSVTFGDSEPTAPVLATVTSRPISELVGYMLKESDNTLAEVIARHVSLAEGFGGASDTLGAAMESALSLYGVSPEGLVIQDGSGLSPLNRVTPSYIAELLVEVYQSQGDLGGLVDALPIAGVDGSLEDRFVGANAIAQGLVFAKTGSIQGTRSLAGIVDASDGASLAFAFFASGEVGDDTRRALDALATAVVGCGSNLADF
jgi:D-alanyl-D-alanine carboxypeptidase/D-alanyl-D-alanine-endopeptidase (penicillin-binding protein 4)